MKATVTSSTSRILSFSRVLFLYIGVQGLITLSILICPLLSTSQTLPVKKDTSLTLTGDFANLSSTARALAEKEMLKRRQELAAHQEFLDQNRDFVLLKDELEKARNFMKQGYMAREINREIDRLKIWKDIAGEGVITEKDPEPTVRNLSTTSILLREILKRTNDRLLQVRDNQKSLGKIQHKIDSLLTDSALYRIPKDSVSLMRFFQRLIILGKDLKPVNAMLRTALDSIDRVEIKVNMIRLQLESEVAETESQRKTLFDKIGLFEKETFGKVFTRQNSFPAVVSFSYGKAKLLLLFYIVNHLNLLILMALFITGLALYLRMLKRRIGEGKTKIHLSDHMLVLKHPVSSSILIGLTLFQFLLPLPPFIINGLFWLLSGIAITGIIRTHASRFWFRAWIAFFILFIFGMGGNLILRQTPPEQFTNIIFSAAGLATGIYSLVQTKKHRIEDKLLLFFIVIMVVCEAIALIDAFAGGYDQAKTFMTSGFFTIVTAYYLYWSVRLARSILNLSIHYHKGHEDEHHVAAHEEPAKRSPFYLYLLFIIGWFMIIARNFYFYQTIFGPLGDMINTTRSIGAFTFTFKSIFIFLLVLIISGFLSRLVAFIASDIPASTGKTRSGGPGSWLLLVRIAVFAAGVLLAFVSAGIPMDRFAIILGALSVGIGFGLQTLVNNLVSGLIIAFEKPVNVGDIVNIAGQTGRMKSIGIRSSVVTTYEGADVIIPNGDLLNQHLMNWTLGSSRRRFEFIVGVAYGTDLEKTRQLLLDFMLTEHRILKHPHPEVLAKQFGNSSIDFVVRFWVPHFDIGLDVKSDLILAIDRLFSEHGIVIPFPQQDVHIRTSSNPADQPEK